MFIKTNIPAATLRFEGQGSNIRGHNVPNETSIPCPTKQIQVSNPNVLALFGNRCGHDPANFRVYTPPRHHKPRPSVLEEAKAKATLALTKLRKSSLGSFNSLNPSGRCKRSERREGVLDVTGVFLHHLELETLQVGFFRPVDGFLAFDLQYIAKQAKMSIYRTARAIKDMISAGYFETIRQCKRKEDGTFSGLPALRLVTVKFFIDLGVDLKCLVIARDWRRKQNEEKFARAAKKKLKGIVQAVTYLGGRAFNTFKKTSLYQPNAKAARQHSLAVEKELLSRSLEMHKLNPARSCSDYYKELLLQLQPQAP